jgi:hypothetical protein
MTPELLRNPVSGPVSRLVLSLLLLFSLVLASGGAAFARDAVSLSVEDFAGGERLLLTWPEANAGETLDPRVELRSSVLIVDLPRAIEADLSALQDPENPLRVARARLDADGRTLRLALRDEFAFNVLRSDNLVAVDVMEEGATSPALVSDIELERQRAAEEARRRAEAAAIEAAKPKGPVDVPVTISESGLFSRIIMEWPVRADYSRDRSDMRVGLQFDWDAEVDMRRLIVDPPLGVISARAERTQQGLLFNMELAPGYEGRVFRNENAVIIDVAQPVEEPDAPTQSVQAAAASSNDAEESEADATTLPMLDTRLREMVPAPTLDAVTETVPVEISPIPGGYEVLARFPVEVGASVYERSGFIYVAFDRAATLGLSGYDLRASTVVSEPSVYSGDDYALLKFAMEGSSQMTPSRRGTFWVFEITPDREKPMEEVLSEREGLHESAAVFFALPDVQAVRRVRDPLIGDDVLVATSTAEAPGNIKPRRYLDATVLTSHLSLAVQPHDDAVSLVRVEGGASLRREGGLRISPPSQLATSEVLRMPDGPAFVNAQARRVPAARFYAEKDRLERQLANSRAVSDYYGLAEFLIANGLPHEALGVLRNLAIDEPEQAREARYAGLSGVASALASRPQDALDHLEHNELGRDPYALVWQAYALRALGQFSEARRQFVAGDAAFFNMPEDWAARLKLANVDAALEMNDVAAAGRNLDMVEARGLPDGQLAAEAGLLRARLMELSGDERGALALLTALQRNPVEQVSAEATYRAAVLEGETGALSDAEIVETLEGLRYRWRGDRLEIEVTEALGEQLNESGDFLQGLRIMRAAIARSPEGAQARRVSDSMNDVFQQLFLEGGAQRLEPIEALGLFYEFADLTPVGADGDRMIRMLADRLVDMDLLKQAAELLEHQTSNRLRGAARAQVSADLAAIYLMDRQPEAALNTLRSTRLSRLPEELIIQRRYLEARALGALGRTSHAFELLKGDDSAEASSLRADLACQAKDYENSAGYLEASAAARMGPLLTPAVSQDLLRAALGYQLSGQDEKLRALATRFGARMRNGPDASAWAVVTNEVQADGGLGLRELASRLTQVDTMDEFLADFRARRAEFAAPPPAQPDRNIPSMSAAPEEVG